MQDRMLAVGCLLVVAGIVGLVAADGTYVWSGQFVAADPAAKTLTVKLKIPERIGNSMNRFKAGDRITVVWDMLERTAPAPAPPQPAADAPPAEAGGRVVVKNESDKVFFIEAYEKMNAIDMGYIFQA